MYLVHHRAHLRGGDSGSGLVHIVAVGGQGLADHRRGHIGDLHHQIQRLRVQGVSVFQEADTILRLTARPGRDQRHELLQPVWRQGRCMGPGG